MEYRILQQNMPNGAHRTRLKSSIYHNDIKGELRRHDLGFRVALLPYQNVTK